MRLITYHHGNRPHASLCAAATFDIATDYIPTPQTETIAQKHKLTKSLCKQTTAASSTANDSYHINVDIRKFVLLFVICVTWHAQTPRLHDIVSVSGIGQLVWTGIRETKLVEKKEDSFAYA